MMQKLWLDLETFSEIPIKNGIHVYAEGVEIMLFAWAIDEGPVNVHDLTADYNLPTRLLTALSDESVLIYAHNSHFDRTVLRHAHPRLAPDVTRWRDTMVQALAHGLPGALGALCEVLGVPQDKAKDKEGKSLIQLFCKPRPKNSKLRRATSKTHPEEWRRFVAYAGLDIEAMREVYKRLPKWNYQGTELTLWHRDQQINDRGVCMDVQLAQAAIEAVDLEQKRLAKRTQVMTDGEVQAATQRDALIKHIVESYGVELPDMQRSTLERRITDPDLPTAVKELLAIRLQASTTSTSKYKSLMKGVSSDGRLRGTLQFCGASRTGRWAGRLFQPQNLPRPSLEQEQIDEGIEALKAGCADLLFDNIMELTSSALRGCIMAPEGKKLVVSDLSNIEGRKLAWLAGEQWKLDAFREYDEGTGPDLYKLAYARAFNISPDDVDKYQRQIGKVMELGLGFGGGVAAFLTFALVYGLDLDELANAALPNIPRDVIREAKNWYDESVKRKSTYGLSERVFIACDSLKRLWRRAHPATCDFWYQLERTVRAAIATPQKTLYCGYLKIRRDGAWLRIQLPSGRALCYPSPSIEKGNITYQGINSYSRKWQRLKTYGGKLVENVTQAAARDVLAGNMPLIEDAGYSIVLTVHDEVICEAPDTDDFNDKALSALLSTNPEWAPDIPLNAGGFEAYHYRKE
ncbi:DNA polymerase [Salmonella enterica]|uniref:DNA-directed DNA polymerase n=2 Tax=Salmonella enterica TaxID=28901 RepID=A0A625ZE53_SALER|nr:DNA polymerase [Salmonella enterica]EAW2137899.1 DNA polymerase [Salmonella enterica subsp. enterica]ECJ5491633.1 DNA polymerase [Salmonella enterica subsp. enterica serovar Braenderup]ECU5352783.1 DNA polymerase [Salmonella enterica subsp. enterica serovar Berta]ECU8041985.1 DNA polymerase [Salmonella enterica subsp. enterica serovar Newport]EDK5354898.1 DNA polymerase [Salmonella enterica subsp. enterica serovar Muenchen]EDR9402923.1 DNA polymerase [Salmonella enterica subsp. enterica se